MKAPELLSPAGTPEAYCAALDGGADAVYFGVSGFNARANARNFTLDEMRRAVYLGHTVGVKSYITLNTLLYDREYDGLLKTAEEIYRGGADAVIVADLGAAALLRKYIPELELHASTQCSGHNLEAARKLCALGFSRFVPARELSLENIKYITENSPIEAEIFVHGALCVSHSGQCLFSSMIGGRSGNRGECAQPCRQKYELLSNGKRVENGYPLSLKDLTLGKHIREIIDANVDSLKIEGRMKSPYYVREVTAIFRTLLDERRDATPNEMRRLEEIFSRGGFTDGYFVSGGRSVNAVISKAKMSGIRSDTEKAGANGERKTQILRQRSGASPRSQKKAQDDTALLGDESFEFKTVRKREIGAKAVIESGKQATITLETVLEDEKITACAEGDVVRQAEKAPLDRLTVEKAVSKLGNTPFFVRCPEIVMGDNVFAATSELNRLRRDAAARLEEKLNEKYAKRQAFSMSERKTAKKTSLSKPSPEKECIKSARFLSADQIGKRANEYFDIKYLPFFEFSSAERAQSAAKAANGIVFPPVIFDSERRDAEKIIENAKRAGIKYALVPNIGEFSLSEGFHIAADFRLNIASAESFRTVADAGKCKSIILSAEATLPQVRDLCSATAADSADAALIVYGRLPLMLLERCILRKDNAASADCSFCNAKSFQLVDRKGIKFPVIREWQHRNTVLNSCPTWMADRKSQIYTAGIRHIHFLFTNETPAEVDKIIDSYEKCLPPTFSVRRI